MSRFDFDLHLFAVVQMLVHHVHFAFRVACSSNLNGLLDYLKWFLVNLQMDSHCALSQ